MDLSAIEKTIAEAIDQPLILLNCGFVFLELYNPRDHYLPISAEIRDIGPVPVIQLPSF